jgi:hypothetical protein
MRFHYYQLLFKVFNNETIYLITCFYIEIQFLNDILMQNTKFMYFINSLLSPLIIILKVILFDFNNQLLIVPFVFWCILVLIRYMSVFNNNIDLLFTFI